MADVPSGSSWAPPPTIKLGKNVEGGDRDVIWATVRKFAWNDWTTKYWAKTSGLWVGIRIHGLRIRSRSGYTRPRRWMWRFVTKARRAAIYKHEFSIWALSSYIIDASRRKRTLPVFVLSTKSQGAKGKGRRLIVIWTRENIRATLAVYID
jgi:hypothetical protein